MGDTFLRNHKKYFITNWGSAKRKGCHSKGCRLKY